MLVGSSAHHLDGSQDDGQASEWKRSEVEEIDYGAYTIQYRVLDPPFGPTTGLAPPSQTACALRLTQRQTAAQAPTPRLHIATNISRRRLAQSPHPYLLSTTVPTPPTDRRPQSWRTTRQPLSWTSMRRHSHVRGFPYTNAIHSGTGYSKLGFAGNDSPSFVFPTAIATKGPGGGAGSSGSGRPAVANKPTFLTGGAGPGGHLSAKRGTEDLDFFIGDEALAASAGPGMRAIGRNG